MRRLRADLEEKKEPRAATSATAELQPKERRLGHIRSDLTQAAIEKPTFRLRLLFAIAQVTSWSTLYPVHVGALAPLNSP